MRTSKDDIRCLALHSRAGTTAKSTFLQLGFTASHLLPLTGQCVLLPPRVFKLGEEATCQIIKARSASLLCRSMNLICDISALMKQVLTIVCKLNPTPEQVVKIEATLKAFADACNYVNQTVKPTITSASSIQNLVYPEVRSIYGLSVTWLSELALGLGLTAKPLNRRVNQLNPLSRPALIMTLGFLTLGKKTGV
ncbi:MAG: hypothetical protein N4J56_005882 [Chroococcidiopsis sp. SAG 2025]|nr:hypothetical protein [Chroococcidiopsis sp. SAG 2025]